MHSIIEEKIAYINTNLERYLNIKYPEIIYESMRYSVFAGGKRLRPILLLSVCEAFGGSREKAIPFACAIEMIHTYSLIHDDLPCMDDDDYRRGKKTNHKVYGEAMAVLSGDALLNLSYEIMSEACISNFSKNSLNAMHLIARAAGVSGMLGGQVVDISLENQSIQSIKPDKITYIHENKTAALITASMLAGAKLADVNDADIKKLSDFSRLFGIAFQIKDDILDVVGDSKTLGKSVGSDLKNDKVTYVAYHGLEKSKEDYTNMLDESFEILESLNTKDNFLHDYLKVLANRNF